MARADLPSCCTSNWFPGAMSSGDFRHFTPLYKVVNALAGPADAVNPRASTFGSRRSTESFVSGTGQLSPLRGRLVEARSSSGTVGGENDKTIEKCGTLAAELLPWNGLRALAIANGMYSGAGGSLWHQPAVNLVFRPSLLFLLRLVVCLSTGRQARADARTEPVPTCKPRWVHQWTRRTVRNWFAISANALSRFSFVELLRKTYVPSGRSDWLEQAESEAPKAPEILFGCMGHAHSV